MSGFVLHFWSARLNRNAASHVSTGPAPRPKAHFTPHSTIDRRHRCAKIAAVGSLYQPLRRQVVAQHLDSQAEILQRTLYVQVQFNLPPTREEAGP